MKGLLEASFILFSLTASGFAWTFFQHDDPTPAYPYPRMVLMGPSGAGKSTLANVLSGCQPNNDSCFETCTGVESCTHETSVNVVTYLGDDYYGSCTLCDTPGFGDSGEEGDGPIITNIVDVLKHKLGDANIIVLCLDYDQRFGPVIQDMILVLESMMGSTRLWDHVLIEITKWAYTEDAIKSRHRNGLTEELALDDINQKIMQISHLNKTLPGVFIDSYAAFEDEQYDQTQQFYYQKYTQELWDMAQRTPPLEFLSIEDIMEELNECRITNECLEGRLTKVENDVLNHTDAISNHEDDISNLENNVIVIEGGLTKVENDVLIHDDAISHHQDDISKLEKTVNSNKLDIKTNSDDITSNSCTIKSNNDTMNSNIDTINTSINTINSTINTINSTINSDIESNTGTIQSNTNLIQTNLGKINSNNANINLNTKAIDALEIGVGVCGYSGIYAITGTGLITYESISGTSTDGSTISTTTGKYTVKTQGLYSITYSAITYGWTIIYLYKDGAQQSDTMYHSHQASAYRDQGSFTVVRCLTEGQEIHLEATDNTNGIYRMQFCVTLLSEASC